MKLRGIVGSKGMCSGKAVIIRDLGDLKNIEEGDVLVTKMTNPAYVPAMRKACGVVTDLGDIASHASIVCRSLEIPCLVATREATNQIKNGDMLKVEAKNRLGTVEW